MFFALIHIVKTKKTLGESCFLKSNAPHIAKQLNLIHYEEISKYNISDEGKNLTANFLK